MWYCPLFHCGNICCYYSARGLWVHRTVSDMFRQLSDSCWLIKPMGRVYRRTSLFTNYWLNAYKYSTHDLTLLQLLQKSHFHVLNQNNNVMKYSTCINNFLNYTDSMYSWYGTYLLLEMFEWADVNVCLGFTCAAHNLRKKQRKTNTTAIKTPQ